MGTPFVTVHDIEKLETHYDKLASVTKQDVYKRLKRKNYRMFRKVWMEHTTKLNKTWLSLLIARRDAGIDVQEWEIQNAMNRYSTGQEWEQCAQKGQVSSVEMLKYWQMLKADFNKYAAKGT